MIKTVFLCVVFINGVGLSQTPAPLANTGSAQVTQNSSAPPWALPPRGIGKPLPLYDGHITPPPEGIYVAMGDSITFGKGVGIDCQAFPTHPVDIETYCPDGQSYVALVAKKLRQAGMAGKVMNLGINGAQVPRVISDELPYLPADATLVTLYIGTNDSRLVRDPKVPVKTVIANYERGYDELLSMIHQKAPLARIVLINFPNQKGLAGPFHLTEDVVARYDETSQAMDKFINDHYPNYAVVSTVCNPKSYDEALQFRGTVHPNEAGAVILANEITDVILASTPPVPPSACEWLNPSSASGMGRKE